jgi:Sulfotransferase family
MRRKNVSSPLIITVGILFLGMFLIQEDASVLFLHRNPSDDFVSETPPLHHQADPSGGNANESLSAEIPTDSAIKQKKPTAVSESPKAIDNAASSLRNSTSSDATTSTTIRQDVGSSAKITTSPPKPPPLAPPKQAPKRKSKLLTMTLSPYKTMLILEKKHPSSNLKSSKIGSESEKERPYQNRVLNLTSWSVDNTQVIQDWAMAQELVGLPVKDALDDHRAVLIERWNGNFATSRPDAHVQDILTYIGFPKVASEEIAANLLVWMDDYILSPANTTSQNFDHGVPCTFAFVRDPLKRFVSAYVEFEFRFERARKLFPEKSTQMNYTFHTLPLGTTERAVAFVNDILGFQVLEWLYDSLRPKYFEVAPFLSHKESIEHFSPMVGQLQGHHIDFLGQLEHLSDDWILLAEQCQLSGLGPFDASLHGHSTSQDPQNTKRAMLQAFDNDCKIREAVCLLYRADYQVLAASPFGYTCTGCNNTIIAPIKPRF